MIYKYIKNVKFEELYARDCDYPLEKSHSHYKSFVLSLMNYEFIKPTLIEFNVN